MSYLFAILGLGVLIVVHEMGHMLMARHFGMRVDRFSVGFGPTLLRYRGDKTHYQLALIPLGGFVQIAGMNPHEQLPPDDPGSYANKSPWARSATILAGPLTNYLFAILIMAFIFIAWGYPSRQHQVATVNPGSPAAQGGMQAKDIITAVGTTPVPGSLAGISQIQQGITASDGKPISFTVQRGDRSLDLVISPRKDKDRFLIGIGFGQQLTFSDVSTSFALRAALAFPISKSHEALSGLSKVFTGEVSTRQVGGPLEIVRQLKMSAEEGFLMMLIFLGMLNVYLGLFNLLPIPALDGGRLVFLAFTLITRRPVNQRIENTVHTVGFVVLMGLILLLTYRDAARLITQP